MSATPPLVLSVDLGSGGPKVGYVRVTGETEWWWHERGDAVAGGARTQDPEAWWTTIVAAARRGIAEGVEADRVAGVAVTGQWASTVPVDERGLPVGECLMWTDTRGREHSTARFGGPVAGYAPRVLATWLRRSGGVPSHTGSDPVSHMLHLLHDRPGVTARARWFLEPVDYLAMRFTGRAAATPASMTAAWLTDNRDPDRVAYDEVLVGMAGLDPSRLPPLVAPGSVLGTVLPEVAATIGIPASARVVTSLPDLHNAAVAAGTVEPGRSHLSLGTSSWISTPLTAKRTDVRRQLAAVPGMGFGVPYLLADNQDNAGRCLEWWRAATAPEATYDDLAVAAAGVAPGSGDVIFTPWLTGERSPIDDRHARGGFHNLSLDTTHAHLTRAVLEGVALNLRWLLVGCERFVGHRFDPVRVTGGGARLDLWCQVLADVLDRRLERVADPLLGGLRGCGLYFGLAAGLVRPGELHDLVPVETTFAPDPATRATYDRLYAQFPRLHSRNRRFFSALNG